MAQQQKFRSALNGFNREDVVRYIEFINAKHTAQINQLTSEAEFLRTRQEADAAAAEEREYQRKHQAREDLIALISGSGYIPTDEDLAVGFAGLPAVE